MRLILLATAVFGILMVSGCSKKAAPANNPQATVMLNDGTSFAGMVTKSSTSEITLTAPNGEVRTYPMSQVSSVQYAGTQTTANSTPPPPPADTASAPSPAPATPAPAPVSPSPSSSAPAPTSPPAEAPAAPPAPITVVRTVPAGSTLVVRNNELIDSKTAAPGQTYSAVISQNVLDSRGSVLIPRGSSATLIVRSANGQGKMQGQSELALDLETVTVAGKRYRVETTDLVQKGREGVGTNKRTGIFTGGGAVLGTLLGAAAGGGRGAAIGALSGGAAGVATQTITRGKGVKVAAETVLSFRLEAPIHIREIR